MGTTRDFAIPILDDTQLEDDETINVRAAAPIGEGLFSFGTNEGFTVVIIRDNDLTFIGNTATVNGNEITITNPNVQSSLCSIRQISVNCEYSIITNQIQDTYEPCSF